MYSLRTVVYLLSFILVLVTEAQISLHTATHESWSRDLPLRMEFSEAISNSLVNTDNIKIIGSETGRVPGTFEGGGTAEIQFTPDSPFRPGELVSVHISNAILEESKVLTFLIRINGLDNPIYEKQVLASATAGPPDLDLGDMDGDGDLDAVVIFRNTGQLIWYENDGNEAPTFTSHVLTDDLNEPSSVQVVDFNLNGHLDIVISEHGTGHILLFSNSQEPTPSFTSVSLAMAPTIQRVLAVDLNSDGRYDLVGTKEEDRELFWFRHEEDAEFTKVKLANEESGTRNHFALGDVDRDLDIDIIYKPSSGGLSYFEQTEGTFSQIMLDETLEGENYVDFNRHLTALNQTIVTASAESGGLYVYEENQTRRTLNNAIGGNKRPVTGYLTSNSPNVVSSSMNATHISIYEDISDGMRHSWQETIFSTNENTNGVFASGDLTGDGMIEIMLASYDENGNSDISWYKPTVEEPASDETDFLTFSVPNQTDDQAIINTALHTIDLEVIHGTDLTVLIPSFTISAGASISPVSGTEQDFSTDVVYTITAEDMITVQEWRVRISEVPSSATDILSFVLPNQTVEALINQIDHTVTIEVADGNDITALSPTITVSDGASISPATGEAQNFSTPVTYQVTAEDETTTQNWVITVNMDEVLHISELHQLKIYPNPVQSILTLDFNFRSAKQRITITDLSGRVVFPAREVTDQLQIDISMLQSGLYSLQYYSGKQKSTYRFIKK